MFFVLCGLLFKVIVVIGGTFVVLFLMFFTREKEETDVMPITDNEDVEYPSIYVNRDILAPYSFPSIASNFGDKINSSFEEDFSDSSYATLTDTKFCYVVDDQEFYERPSANEDLVEFTVVKKNKMDCEYDTYCSTPTSESEVEEDHSTELEVTLKFVSNGYIVNGNCFLSWQQWHTIVPTTLSNELAQCCVCAVYCEIKSCEEHVNSDVHRQALVRSPPLHAFDLSITRKIKNNYHCGVCNELFPLNLENEHFSSKMHEGNLLFAINKASDLIEGYDYKKKETFHFKNRNNIVDNRLNDNYHRENDRYKSVTETYRRHTDSISADSDQTNYNDNTNFINFQNCYEDFEDDITHFTGVSYANIAKIPKAQTQTFIDIDLGNKKVKVRFDSWHMVISHKQNRFWCMVCKVQDHLRKKVEHCNEAGHLENLDKCHVVEAYEEYFIRQVDDKLYHCGHCNNLQLIHEMEDHVESNHPRRTKLVTDAKNLKIAPITTSQQNSNTGSPKNNIESPTRINEAKKADKLIKNTQSPAKNTASPTKTKGTQSNNSYQDNCNNNNIKNTKNSDITNNNSPSKVTSVQNGATANKSANDKIKITNADITHKMPGILDDMVIYPFGFKITVPSLSYNIVCKRPNDYYCGLCDIVVSEEAITGHIYDIHHIELLQRTPFILPFNCNLIRAIRDALHCAICNVPITADKIYLHIKDPQHTTNLTKALGHNQPNIPSIGANISNNPTGVNVPNNPLNNPVEVNIPNKSIGTNIPNNPIGVNIPKNPMNNPNGANIPNNPLNNPVGVNIPNKPTGTNIPNNPIGVNIPKNPMNNPNGANIPNNPLKNPVGVNIPNNPIGMKIPNNPTANLPNLATNVLTDKITLPDLTKPPPIINNTPRVETPISPSPKPTIEENDDEEYLEENSYEEYSDEENMDETFDSQEDASFDFEEFVYLKLKNTYIKITNTSYNTLVDVGDGSRYCFVCSYQVQFVDLQKHVDSRSHLENMEKYRFLDKYEDHLLRQIYLNYHCSICNVILTRKELKNHLEWPTHALQNDNTLKNIKKTRKNEIKGGIKQISVYTQQENIYLQEKEPKLKICFNVKVTDTKDSKTKKKSENVETTDTEDELRKHKIIIFKDNVLKISWDSWNGISKVKNGYKCILCQRDLKNDDINVHCNSEWHKYGLDKPFEKQYAPALVRKINESTLNCLICNTEVAHKGHLTTEHISGKKHLKNYETILKESSMANTYSDCNNDVLML